MTIGLAAQQVYDDSAWQELTERCVAEARARGAFTFVLLGLVYLAYNQLFEGRIAAAEATVAEGRTPYPAGLLIIERANTAKVSLAFTAAGLCGDH